MKKIVTLQAMAFKFRHKVLVALGALVLLSLGIVLAVTLWRLQSTAEERVIQGLESATNAFALSRKQQEEAVVNAVEALAQTNMDLVSVVAGRNNQGDDPFAQPSSSSGTEGAKILESFLPFTKLYRQCTQFVVYDLGGNVIFAKEKSFLPSGEGGPQVVREALEGKHAYDWWQRPGTEVIQVFASPILQQQAVIGAIAVGYPIDENFLAPLAKISRTKIELANGGDQGPAGLHEFVREGQKRLGSLVSIQSPSGRVVGSFLISRSIEEEMREAHALRNQLLLLCLFTLLAAAALASYLASLVSRPLVRLGSAVKEVGAGNFAFRLHSQAKDEFGTLGRLIDEMAAGLEERELIRATFNRYVDNEVVSEILKSQGAEALAGAEREISVLFTDLANFTAFSEGKPPKEVLRDLNGYFASMARAIDEQKGILDKFIGDAIMAYWGAPVANPRHAELACRAALEQKRCFLESFLPDYPTLGMRIGISTGNALVGNVGSERRQNYTVMGDTVNLASRLEGVNKVFGTFICVSEATKRGLEEMFLFRLLGRVRVAGRQEPECVFELLGERAAMVEREAAVRSYEKALSHFEAGDFAEAMEIARALADAGDKAAEALVDRCLGGSMGDASGAGWDGVWILGK